MPDSTDPPTIEPQAGSQSRMLSDLTLAYEEYKKEMSKAEGAAQRGEAGQIVLERIRELEELFLSVTSSEVKELSMYMKDSEALRRTAEFAYTNAEHVRFGDLGGTLPLGDFLKAAKRYMNPDLDHGDEDMSTRQSAQEMNERFNSLNWKKLGVWFYSRGKVPVPSHFLYGPLATKRRRMAPRTRTVDDTLSSKATTTARKVSASDLQDDPEQSTSHMVKSVYKVLNDKHPDAKINLFQYFVNPNSFAQSVENLFYTSFLVRDGRLKIEVGPDKVPYVQIHDQSEEDDNHSEESPLAHHIASFNMSAWRALIDKYNITKSYIPHRETEEDRISDSSDSSGTEEDP